MGLVSRNGLTDHWVRCPVRSPATWQSEHRPHLLHSLLWLSWGRSVVLSHKSVVMDDMEIGKVGAISKFK